MSIFNTGLNPLKNTKVVPVFLTINSAYAPYAAAAIHSLTQHVDPKRYYRVIILHDGLNLVNRWRLRSLVTKNVALASAAFNIARSSSVFEFPHAQSKVSAILLSPLSTQ